MSARARRRADAWAGGRRGQSQARFHRERDRRRLRAMAMALGCAGALVIFVLGVVALKVQQVRLSYRLDALRTARTELDETRGRLRVELASLKSLARIDGKARGELGMSAPAREQVLLAREFVPGGGGVSALAPLTASAERDAIGDPAKELR